MHLVSKDLAGFLRKDSELTLDQLLERAVIISGTSAGEAVTPEIALKSPTCYAVVNRLSSMFGELSFSVVRDLSTETSVRYETIRNHAASRLVNRRPNRWQTPVQFREQMLTTLLLYGYYLAFKDERLKALRPIGLEGCQLELKNQTLVARFTDDDGKRRTARGSQLFYVCGPIPLNGVVGKSVVECGKEAIGLEIAAEKFAASTFGSGAIPNIILTRQGKFADQEAAGRFKALWNNLFGGKKRGTAVLEGDQWDVHTVQMKNDEAQFLESRKLQRSVLAGMFNVPPHMVGDLERATFSNISSQSLEVLMYTASPWITRIEEAINRDLLTEAEVEQGLSAKFDTKKFLRGDLKSTADFISKMRTAEVISANEGRAMIDMNSRDEERANSLDGPVATAAAGSADDSEEQADDDGDAQGLRAVR